MLCSSNSALIVLFGGEFMNSLVLSSPYTKELSVGYCLKVCVLGTQTEELLWLCYFVLS